MMRKLARQFFLALGYATLLLSSAASQELRIGYSDQELPPFLMGAGNEQPNPPGIHIELINQVAKELGMTVKYVRQPTKQGQNLIKNGTLDAYFSLSYQKERLVLGQFPMKNGKPDGVRRMHSLSYYLYKLKTNPISYDGKKIKNVSMAIGANLGYSIAEDIRKMGYAVEEVKSTDSNLKKLQLGRLCAFAGQDADTDALIEGNEYKSIVKIPIPLASKDYFLVFSNQFVEQHGDVANRFWTKLGQIRERVTKDITHKYRPKLK